MSDALRTDRFTWPDEMLDDRIAIVGTAGSGKTYAAKGLVERLINLAARVCIIDPLGVWFGLRAGADGDAAGGLPVTIFGGLHADVPITERDGEVLGRIIAGADIRCIVDVSELPSGAARRRFMLGLTGALYDANRAPLHLVLDEADSFAPQNPNEDAGPALLGRIEQIVRRGRARGFVPWLITQRPAVLNKNVLSQADILIAMKLTASQDRNAIGAWIEGQADREVGKRILAELPRMPRGAGYVWAPSHDMLRPVSFPPISTFDSSRTPKRGETIGAAALLPVDTNAIAKMLVRERAPDKQATATSAAGVDLDAIRSEAYQDGFADGLREAAMLHDRIVEMRTAINGALSQLVRFAERPTGNEPLAIDNNPPAGTVKVEVNASSPMASPAKASPTKSSPAKFRPPANGSARPRADAKSDAGVTGPQSQVLGALIWWIMNGHLAPSRAQVAGIIGWKITSGHLKNVCGTLRSAGLIDYPSSGTIALTSAGRALAPKTDLSAKLHDRVRGSLNGPQRLAFDHLLRARGMISREDLCAALGWEATSGHIKNVLGSMRTLQIVDYPRPGAVSLQPWLRS